MNKINIFLLAARAVYITGMLIFASGALAVTAFLLKFCGVMLPFGYTLCLVPFFAQAHLSQFAVIKSMVYFVTFFRSTKLIATKTFGLPLLAAQWAWENNRILYVNVLCIIGMLLFWIHPTGRQVYLYPLYWIIPMITSVFMRYSAFARALTASFVAHVVGSVFYLYIFPTVPSYWIALLPRVPVERLACAILMVSVHYITTYFVNFIKSAFDFQIASAVR